MSKGEERVEMTFTEASDNLYADAGDPDAEAMQTKALLTYDIFMALERLGLSEQRAADMLDIPKSEFAMVMRGEFREISPDTIAGYLQRVKTLPG
jgi:predicted XRE-type DNA-binding protein